jgi:ABC-2 type transport system permease protein
MTVGTALRRRVWRAMSASNGFLRMGFVGAMNHPLGFVFGQSSNLVQLVIFFFVAKLVVSGPQVGGDYFTFVVLGEVGLIVMSAGLIGFSTELDKALSQGHFEMLLAEPIPWRMLPFGMMQWPASLRLINLVFIFGLSMLLGAQFVFAGWPVALLLIVLGVAGGLAISLLAASVKVLAKKGDPVLIIYQLAAQVLAGQYFNIELLPAPLRFLSYTIPATYVNIGLRRTMMPAGDALPGATIEEAVIALVVFNVVMYPIAIWVFGRSMEYGRKMGLLSGY